jgi:hypothetical protein
VAQGWDVTGGFITFYEAPPVGVNNVVVNQYAQASVGATDVFALSAWNPGFGWPQEVEFFADRLIFARTYTQPQTAWFSQVSDYSNFGKSTPIVDSDAITATLNARRQNAIEELVPLDKLVMLTAGGEWRTDGGQDDVLTPETLSWKPQSYWGSSKLPALVIGNTALFTQARGYIVRDIGYQFESDGYTGSDLTIFSSHLVIGYQLVDWDFHTIPYSCAWIVRDDGTLLSCTYMKEQGVNGWAWHDTLGYFESVVCIPEGNEDFAYFVVRRNINGVDKRYVERLNTRLFANAREWFFVDCGLTYDGRNTTATTMTLTSPGGGWTDNDTLRITASASTFVGTTDEGDWVVFDYEGDMLRMVITNYVSATQADVQPVRNVPAEWQGVATTNWAIGRDVIGGLQHLATETVAILADGFVQAQRAVSGGGLVTLDNPGVVVHIGLPYVSEMKTLSVNAPGAESIRGRGKNIKKVNLLVEQARNILVGPSEDRLEEWESRDDEDMQLPPNTIDGMVTVHTSSDWNENGQVMVRQSDPLALSIVGIIPEVELGTG